MEMRPDRKSTRLNSSHTVIYTPSLHHALPIYSDSLKHLPNFGAYQARFLSDLAPRHLHESRNGDEARSEEHTSELQSHSDLHSFPTPRSSDLFGFSETFAKLRCLSGKISI